MIIIITRLNMFRKNFKTVKTGIIIGTLLLSLVIAFVPTSSAGFINVPPLINVTYPKSEEALIPNSGVLDIPLSTTFTLTGPFASFVEKRSLLRKKGLNIELNVVEKQDWCEASISNPLAQFSIKDTEPYGSILTVTVNENAPAFTQGLVTISATSELKRGLFFNIPEETVEYDVSFIIGYLSVVSYEMPNGTSAEIEKSDTADFKIDIKNLGNGPTKVEIKLIDVPEEDWDVNIPSTVLLSSATNSGDKTSESVHFRIKPKKSSDWNNEIKTFKVKFTPSYMGKPELVGQQEIITFNVQKIGSIDEEESVNTFLIILIVAIILIILILIILKRRFSQYTK
jgi:hypothetical protein